MFEFEEDYEYQDDIEILGFQLIELVTPLIIQPNLYNVIKFGTFPLKARLAEKEM